jgi:hypothetical protein
MATASENQLDWLVSAGRSGNISTFGSIENPWHPQTKVFPIRAAIRDPGEEVASVTELKVEVNWARPQDQILRPERERAVLDFEDLCAARSHAEVHPASQPSAVVSSVREDPLDLCNRTDFSAVETR